MAARSQTTRDKPLLLPGTCPSRSAPAKLPRNSRGRRNAITRDRVPREPCLKILSFVTQSEVELPSTNIQYPDNLLAPGSKLPVVIKTVGDSAKSKRKRQRALHFTRIFHFEC